MKINFTKKQYWDLFRAVYMSDWMSNAVCEQDEKFDEGIKNIRNYIFSFAKEMGCEEYIGHDDRFGYYAQLKLDDEPSIRSLIKRYDEHVFWDELTERLAEREIAENFTPEEWSNLTHEERMDTFWQAEARWSEEFEQHGIERLRIIDMKMKTGKSQ